MRMVVSVALICLALAAGSHDEASARYIGNAGVLVSDGETKVLFDAFYANSYGQYLLVDDQTSSDLISGSPPFDGVDAVFVSHVHGDHFTAEPTLKYLRAQPEVLLFGSGQVIETLTATLAESDPIHQRLRVVANAPADGPFAAHVGSIAVEAVGIPHSGGERHASIANLSFRVTLDGETTAVHFGDAAVEESAFARHREHWDQRQHDIAFPPYWFWLDPAGPKILSEYIKADQTVGVHVPERAAGQGDAWREQAGGDLFTDPGEIREIE